MISNNKNSAIEEIIVKFGKKKKNEDVSVIRRQLEYIHKLTEEVNHNVSKVIMIKEGIVVNNNDEGGRQNEIGNFSTAICIGIVIVIIGVVSYLKVNSE